MLQTKQFDRLEQFAKLQKPPAVKFKDLEEVVNHKIIVNLMPFDVRADFVKVTGDTVLVPVTIQVKNRDITFVNKDGVQRGTVNIFGRRHDADRQDRADLRRHGAGRRSGRIAAQDAENSSVYWKALPLRPGRYRSERRVKDVNGDRVGTWSSSVVVPEFTRRQACDFVADRGRPDGAGSDQGDRDRQLRDRHHQGTAAGGSGRWQAGDVQADKDQKLNFWMQVYNLGVDEKTHKPSATFEYNITNVATNKAVVQTDETDRQMGNIGDQVTLQKSIVRLPICSPAFTRFRSRSTTTSPSRPLIRQRYLQ